jgi:Amt family ammonium transporter
MSSTETDLALLAAYTNGMAQAYGNSNTNFWLMFGAVLVFFMQAGFAMLEVGMVNVKNTKNILIKNVFDASIGALCWWFLGAGFANGTSSTAAGKGSSGGFIGTDSFYDDGVGGSAGSASWLFGWAFAATAATIVSGAVAERVTFGCYIIYSVVLTAFIYPVVVHWGWAGGFGGAWKGCLSLKDDGTCDDDSNLLFGCGVTDFAGSGVVHLTGAVAAFVGAAVIGPRIGRFDEGIKLPQQSVIFQTLGTLILWVGWYGFNGASTLMLAGYSSSSSSAITIAGTSFNPIFDFSNVAGHAMVTTTISAATCCLTTTFVTAMMSPDKVIDIGAANNGILAGLVSITAGCSTVNTFGAMCIGLIGAFWYIGGCKVMDMLKIDDVVGAVPVHGFCGVWGVFATGLFATKEMYSSAYYSSRAAKCAGVFYGGDGSMLSANIVFLLAVIVWTGALSAALFIGIKVTIGVRVSKEVEENGMDDSKHGGKVFSATPVPTQEV